MATTNHDAASARDSTDSAKLRVRTVEPVYDPFRNDTIRDMPAWWKYGVQVFCGLTLLPARLSLLLFVVVPLTLLALVPFSRCLDCCCSCRCCQFGTAPDDADPDDHPHGCCRTLAVYPLRLLSRAMLWCLGVWWISVERQQGSARTAADRPVVVANHTSLLDAMFGNWFLAPMAVGKLGVKHIPVAGGVAMALQTIFVDRKDPNSKHKVLEKIKKRTHDPRFPSLMIYPEGTCTNGKCLVQFKKGPFTAQQNVQPLILRYSSPYYDVAACGDNNGGMVQSFLLMMCQPWIHLKCTMMPVYKPTAAEQADAILFARNVRAKMADEMRVPVTEHSYEDVFFVQHMQKVGKKQVGNEFVVKDIRNAFNLSKDAINALLDRFAGATGKKSVMDVDEFCRCLDLKVGTREAEMLFHFFDNDDSGHIEFPEFIRGVALLSQNVNDVDRLKLAFAMLDHEKEGKVALADLRQFLADAERLNVVRGYVQPGEGVEEAKEYSKPAAVAAVADVETGKGGADAGAGHAGAGAEDGVWRGSNASDHPPNRRIMRQSSLGECFSAIDEDADGFVTFEEFVELSHRRGTLAGPLLEVAQKLVGSLAGVVEAEEEEGEAKEEKQ